VRHVAGEDPKQRLGRISHIVGKVELHSGSMESYASIFKIIEQVRPDECYHLASQSFVAISFEDPFSTFNTNINGTLFLLESLKVLVPKCKFYFAGSSEMFGKAEQVPQNEQTRFHPRSPYGISKVTCFELTRNYREAYDIFACTGILFNHESERRGMEFVTRKISSAVAAIKLGKQKKLFLGNLDAKRDWGYAPEYVKAMWLMLQQETADDYIVATGETHSVGEFAQAAFEEAGLDWKEYVEVDERFKRPAEVDLLVGDCRKARQELGWQHTIGYKELAAKMLRHDLERLSRM